MSNIEENEDNDEYSSSCYGYVDRKQLKTKDQPKIISLKMIITRNLNKTDTQADYKTEYKGKFGLNEENELKFKSENDDDDDVEIDKFDAKAKQLLKLTHIHLDREQIGEIDNLAEYLGSGVTNLYLQSNLIKQIENLEFLTKLKFLTLQNNQICKIENLTMLIHLKLLDLSQNLINEINVKELPKNLSFLDLRENVCLTGPDQIWTKHNYSDLIRNYLKDLKQLNGENLTVDSSDEEDENEANNNNYDKNESNSTDTFQTLSERIVARSKQRQEIMIDNMDEISKQRRMRMEQARQSIDQNIKNIIIKK